jgi:hypothetical protein
VAERICRACVKRSKDEKWYPFSNVDLVTQENCEFHPAMTNWRTVRTLKTLRAWSLEPDGATVTLDRNCRMPIQMGGGHIHERTARAKMFDYEGPMIDLLVKEGYVDRHEGTPKTLTVTRRGDEFIRVHLLERELRDGVKTTADFKRG